MHSTNYYNTFIEVAEDCPVQKAETPPLKSEKTVASLQFELIGNEPYLNTSDDVIFQVYAIRKGVNNFNLKNERKIFFVKGQPCLRSSPLAKRYGWGIHSNEEGKLALYPIESEEYRKLANDENLKHVKAMRSKRIKNN